MRRYINIYWNEDVPHSVRSLVESLLNVIDNIAYGYDIDDDYIFEEICEVLDDHDISYSIEEDDV